jgi:hypothetical protein
VAVVETTDKTYLLSSRRPYREHEIRFFDANLLLPASSEEGRGRTLIMSGYPVHFTQYTPGEKLKPRVGKAELASNMVSMRVGSMPPFMHKHQFPEEPSEGRGVHVLVTGSMDDSEGVKTPLLATHGFSGGPIVAPDGEGVLVGLVRGCITIAKGWDQWCEPAAEAVRLLMRHPDRDVAAAAERVWNRYEQDRQNARRVIAEAAYFKWCARGAEHGRDQEDWYKAERRLAFRLVLGDDAPW